MIRKQLHRHAVAFYLFLAVFSLLLLLGALSARADVNLPAICTSGASHGSTTCNALKYDYPQLTDFVKIATGQFFPWEGMKSTSTVIVCGVDVARGATSCPQVAYKVRSTLADGPPTTPPPVTPPDAKSAVITWEPSAKNTDGTDVQFGWSGSTIYHGTEPGTLTKLADVPCCFKSYTAKDLAPGTHYFAVTTTVEDLRCQPGGACGPSVFIESVRSPVISKVIAAANAPTCTMAVSPSDGIEAATPKLSWSCSNAQSCTASGGWSGTKAASGEETLAAITASTTYTLTCTGAGGQAETKALVIVSPRPASPTNITVQ